MIQAKNIHKYFDKLHVLKGVDLQIENGEIVSIVGASGAGKTTLLQIIGTLDGFSEGELIIDNTRVANLNRKALAKFRNEHLGFIFQFHQLLPEFTALENVCIPAFIKKTPRAEAEKKAKDLLAFLGLSDREDHKPNELSGGEQQRDRQRAIDLTAGGQKDHLVSQAEHAQYEQDGRDLPDGQHADRRDPGYRSGAVR